MGIEIVEQRAFRMQPKRYCKAAANRFNQPPVGKRVAIFLQMRNKPAIAASPLERRARRSRFFRLSLLRGLDHPRTRVGNPLSACEQELVGVQVTDGLPRWN